MARVVMVILSDRLSFFGVHPELGGVVELWAKRVSEELSWRARPPARQDCLRAISVLLHANLQVVIVKLESVEQVVTYSHPPIYHSYYPCGGCTCLLVKGSA